tara:strand:- start:255 stop:434 length:180 start_codon:yes stop_codon:yes gene_type:complete
MMTISAEKQKQLEGLVKPGRVAMPEIEIDIDIADNQNNKSEALEYIKSKYTHTNEPNKN